jgi:hypothetical protein
MRVLRTRLIAAAAAVVLSATGMAPATAAQVYGSQMLASGTAVPVRTTEEINVNNVDGQVFSAVVDEDVLDANGRVAIPQGATAELIVRKTSNNDLTVDLDSVTVNGQRFAVGADQNAVGTSGSLGGGASTIGKNKKTATYIGGGALLGAVIGAVAGGGKGAAIGAATGAAAGAGAQIITQGRTVRVPAESLLTFRLSRDLNVGVQDDGYNRNNRHYHRY